MDQDETWHAARPRAACRRGQIVLDGDQAYLPQRGTEVGHGPGHIVLDGDPAPPNKKGTDPIFGPCLLWLNGWMDQDTTR